ncbi:MAG: hypothetical protein NTV02_01265 [Candidatus Zambryskibacteria bacterium]|nr:hypothetical protein [Candidatus Zambryskibacteria bacterium]
MFAPVPRFNIIRKVKNTYFSWFSPLEVSVGVVILLVLAYYAVLLLGPWLAAFDPSTWKHV